MKCHAFKFKELKMRFGLRSICKEIEETKSYNTFSPLGGQS